MFGALIGDIAGSRFEFANTWSKDFELLHPRCYFTDDTVMTVSVAEAMLRKEHDARPLTEVTVACMQEIGRRYPDCGYGGMFYRWMFTDSPKPYNSFGNGSAMRVSPVAWVAESLEECVQLSRQVTAVSHNHPEGLKGAEATAVAIWMARRGNIKEDILQTIRTRYYPLDFTIDGIRRTYVHNETCQDSVPQAIEAFAESSSFEDCIRIAISLGGDSDTIAAIAGSIAEAYYGIPKGMVSQARRFLSPDLLAVVDAFEARYGRKLT